MVTRRNTRRGVVARQIGEHVGVAGDQRALGDHADRVAELGKHLEAAPRDAEAALDGLIAIGVARQATICGSHRGAEVPGAAAPAHLPSP